MLDIQLELAELEKLRAKLYHVFPAFITHIRFPRYKNMGANTKIEFTFPITALVGPNGSGKTSVLNALYGAPNRYSTGDYWFSTEVDPIEEGEGSPNRFIYGHYNTTVRKVVETRKARVRKVRNGRADPNYWEPTKEAPGDAMQVDELPLGKKIVGRSSDRWNPVSRKVLYINFRKELSAFDKYFYFGKDPAIEATRKLSLAKRKGNTPPSLRIRSKKDRIRHDAALLARVIIEEGTSIKRHKRKIATENRLLNAQELAFVSFILGQEYTEARWIKHRLFQGDGGLSIVFKTKHGLYSEAFAGSGEVAVTSCVVQVLQASKGTLILLDEPEVSLHPGAQERLLAFLAKIVKRNQIQVVFSTHSPHLISALPDDAIKSFYRMPSGVFGVIQATHPYAAFRRLGALDGGKVHVIVEDRLAQAVVKLAVALIEDDAKRDLFSIEYVPGGATSILNLRIPVLMERQERVMILLDGDQQKVADIVNPDEVPASENDQLEAMIFDQVGAKPVPMIDGGTGGGNTAQKIDFWRCYLSWVRDNLRFIPTSCPEELIMLAAGKVSRGSGQCSQYYKDLLHEAASENVVGTASSEEADTFGQFLLGQHRADSPELLELRNILEYFLSSMRAA
ncbi:ATP-dependent nuclease [Halopseudomonas sp.]|jgi:predicted ATPase|uniref:ATP-dependent nuclease n=1 Tax=Halopseudomonas sp. TaxID=2901191 RepID=UPI0039E51B3B